MELWELIVRECCRDTLAQYTHAGDRFLLDEYAASFCEDGVLEIKGTAPVLGRDAIIDRVASATGPGRPLPRKADGEPAAPLVNRIVRHNVTNIRFEGVSPTEATVASYFTVFTEIGLDHMGRYRDRLVPVDDRWLIAHRLVSTDWRAPNTTFGGGSPSPSPDSL